MSNEQEEYAKRAERIKSLLSSYYGADGPPPDAAGGQAAAAPAPAPQTGRAAASQPQGAYPLLPGVLAMDSPHFKPEEHVAQLLKIYPLEKLIGEHRTLARQIKSLDSDMQQLVYENYNKFISATDTIRAMKSNVDGMSTDMASLKSAPL